LMEGGNTRKALPSRRTVPYSSLQIGVTQKMPPSGGIHRERRWTARARFTWQSCGEIARAN
jgi:hypothetical protein